MDFNNLLIERGIDPEVVVVLRHRPFEAEFQKVFPFLAADREDLFNAYQKSHGAKLEKVLIGLEGKGYIATFIAHGAGKALFIGLYKISGSSSLTFKQYWSRPDHLELKTLGMQGFTGDRPAIQVFDLVPDAFYRNWKGKLVIEWSAERSWWRRAHKNEMLVHAILEESALDAPIHDWRLINLSWGQLKVLPASWKASLAAWRAIYYISDVSTGKGYVGSAYGAENLLGRWLNYASTGHGGNSLLRKCDKDNFRFTILERLGPDTDPDEVIRLESTWKGRLHTRAPSGLNDN